MNYRELSQLLKWFRSVFVLSLPVEETDVSRATLERQTPQYWN